MILFATKTMLIKKVGQEKAFYQLINLVLLLHRRDFHTKPFILISNSIIIHPIYSFI